MQLISEILCGDIAKNTRSHIFLTVDDRFATDDEHQCQQECKNRGTRGFPVMEQKVLVLPHVVVDDIEGENSVSI